MSNTARRTAITYPDGRVVSLGYGASGSIEDAFGLLKTVAIEGESGNKVDYTRVGLGRYVKIAYPEPGVEMSMIRPDGGSEGDSGDPYDGFDRFSRVQEMRWQGTASGTPIDAWKWGYNEASNRTWKKNLVAASGQDEAYAYDGLSQVIRDAVGTLNTNRTAIGGIPGEEEDFTYDPTGNWLAYRKNEDGSPVLDQSRSNNKDNQLTQIDGSSQGIEYDRAGNAVKIRPGLDGDWSKHFTLVWDGWNRLVEVKDENGVTVQKNTYDGLSRRITKESGGTVVHTYWSDRWKPVEERIDSATTAARSYFWGERPGHRDELVLRDRDTNEDGTLDERLYATMDYFNGTSILDPTGNVLERYAYAAFGPRRVMAPDFTSRGSSLYDWDFGFQGQFRDAETGWYNYGYRFYVPELGRWINRDPIGEDGGDNLYMVFGNDAVNSVDYLGLAAPQNPRCCDLTVDPNDHAPFEIIGDKTLMNPCNIVIFIGHGSGTTGTTAVPQTPIKEATGTASAVYACLSASPVEHIQTIRGAPPMGGRGGGVLPMSTLADVAGDANIAFEKAENQAITECAGKNNVCKTIRITIRCFGLNWLERGSIGNTCGKTTEVDCCNPLP